MKNKQKTKLEAIRNLNCEIKILRVDCREKDFISIDLVFKTGKLKNLCALAHVRLEE